MVEGPAYDCRPVKGWMQFLEKKNIQAFYHDPRIYGMLKKVRLEKLFSFLAPRGFASTDDVGGPSNGDRITVRQDVEDAFLKAIPIIRRGEKVPFLLWNVASVLPHEFKHTKPSAVPTTEELEVHSHPNALRPALSHASRIGFRVNTFSGALRFRQEPREDLLECIAWFEAKLAERRLLISSGTFPQG